MSNSKRMNGLASTHFGEVHSFEPKLGGYAAVPWIFRTILRTMTARQWTLLSYFYLRSGPEGLSWETDETIGADLGIGPKKVGPHIRALQDLGLIVAKRVGRNRYVKLVDPMEVAEQLLAPDSPLNEEERSRLADDFHMIRQVQRRSNSSKVRQVI